MLLKDKLIEIKNKIDSPDAEIIFQHVLKIEKANIYSDVNKEINKKDLSSIDLMVEERLRGKPLAYLIGKKGFWKNSFIITPDVLVPRPETETLVDAILYENLQGKTLLELGTGSGAISISIAQENKDCLIFATDISIKSILVAKKNAEKFNCENVIFLNHDWNNEWLFPQVDYLISNPPYVYKEVTTGKEEGIWHEPEKALFSKDRGLSDLKLILSKAKNFLTENGKVYLEHAPDQYEELNKFAEENGYLNFSNINDLNGDKRVSIYQC
jgi:release factor glutamine methyltransferase